MDEITNPKAFEALLKSLHIKKNNLSNELGQMLKTIESKHDIIQKFEHYNDEYKTQIAKYESQNLSQHMNNEQFLSKIAEVLFREKEQIKQLKSEQQLLMAQYNQIIQQIDSIEDLLNQYGIKVANEKEKQLDNELTELAVNRSAHATSGDT